MAKASSSRKKRTSKKSRKLGAKKKSRSGKRPSGRKVSKSRKKSTKSKKAKARKASRKSAKKKVSKKKSRKKASRRSSARKKTVKTKTRKKKKAARKNRKKKTSKKKVAKRSTAAAAKKTSRSRAPESPRGKLPEPSPETVLPSIEDALKRLPYREGSFVVHPKYGLGKVDRIVDRKLSTRTVPCMEIGFPYQDMKLTIPVDQVERSGLRRPIGRKDIDGVFKVLRGRATFDAKRRSAKRVVDYRKRLNMGDPKSLAEAIRDLARLSLKKSLSYEERKILGTALRILSREVALARKREPDDVREEIEKIVYR